MPIGFWGDEKNKKYFGSYFERFDSTFNAVLSWAPIPWLFSCSLTFRADVWTHGDFIAIDPVTKSIIFHGRADGVLNPSGVRFGSAEIYSVIDAFFAKQVADSVCVGRRRAGDVDVSLVLRTCLREILATVPDVPKHLVIAWELHASMLTRLWHL